MIDMQILAKRGLTVDRLKDIFTAKIEDGYSEGESKFAPEDGTYPVDKTSSEIYQFPEDPTDYDIRRFFEERIRFRLEEGMQRSFEVFDRYAAVDLALDTPAISKMHLPLAMLAQGYIDIDRCSDAMGKLSKEWSSYIFEKGDNGKILKVNIPKFWEISHNLVLSLLSRRVAAIGTPIAQAIPFLKYESRSTTLEGDLRADLMTQRAEIMADDYGYRHDVIQTTRDVSAYTHQVEFLRSAWDRNTQTLSVPVKDGEDDGLTGLGPEGTDFEDKEVIVKEGLDFTAPHPSRVFWDHAYPLAKLNTDTGPTYAGHWDMVRLGELRTNMDYWNRDAIEWDQSVYDFLSSKGSDFFTLYYRDRIALPSRNSGNISLNNDRASNMGYFAEGTDDFTVTIANYYEKINPKQWGIADYDHDVWIRFVVAGNNTVIFAEPLACSPAVVYHYNENDQRDSSPSFAEQVIPYQDQVNNLLSQLLEIQFQGLMKIFTLNRDGMTDAQVQAVEDAIQQRKYTAAKNIVISYSSEALNDMGMDSRKQYTERMHAVQISTTEKTSELIRSIVQVISLAERNLFFSPQELGQVAPREISATEANIVNNTTLGIRDFHALGIYEGLDAKKRLIYEATVALGTDEIELPVMGTYSRETIERAGFRVIGANSEGDPKVLKRGKFTVAGDRRDLVHNYVYTSRDGTEREVSSAVANAIVQVFDIVGRYPTLQKFLTNEDGVNLLSAVTNKLGLPLRIKLPEDMDPLQPLAEGTGEQVVQAIQQLGQAMQQIAQQQQQQGQAIDQITQALSQLPGGQTAPTPQGAVSQTTPSGAPPLSPQPPQPAPVGLGFEQ